MIHVYVELALLVVIAGLIWYVIALLERIRTLRLALEDLTYQRRREISRTVYGLEGHH